MTRDRIPIVRFIRRFFTEILFAALVVVLFSDYLFSDKLLYGTDMIPAGLFFRGLLVDFVKDFGELPRWNPYILGGLPFLDATHGDTYFPTSWLQFVMPDVYRALGHKLIVHIFLAGVFMAFYLRSLRLHPKAVAFGGLAFMLSPVLVSYLFAGQDAKMYVTSLTPLVLGILERAMRSGKVGTFLWLGVVIGLVILTSHIQMAYHCMWFVAALFVLRLWRGPAGGGARLPALRVTGLFVVAITLGVLIASIQLWPAVAYVKHPDGFSVRSTKTDYAHATSWCLHPEEIGSLVVPEFCNAPQGYWGRNVFKYNSDYMGVLTLFLVALALSRKRDATRWFLGGLGLFAILYSLGQYTPLHRLFYAVVPQVKLFRAPPLIMFGAAFGFAALAAHAVHDLATQSSGKTERGGGRKVIYGGFAAAGLILMIALGAKGFTAFWTDVFQFDPPIDASRLRAQVANLPAFRSGALLVAGVLGLGVAAVLGRRTGKLSMRWMFVVLVVLTIFDLWRVDAPFKRIMDADRWINPDPLIAPLALESRQEKFRVAPLVQGYSTNEIGYHGIESIYGFHDNELSWYRQLRDRSENLLALSNEQWPFLRILNVKYLLHNQPGYPNPMPVPGYLPRFRIVEEYEVIAERESIPRRIADPTFDPATHVILEESPGFASAGSGEGGGRVTAFEYRGNEIWVEVEAEQDCLLVHAENWFPYWSVLVDGTEGRLLRAYGTVRAVPLSAGHHELLFSFESKPFEWGKRVTLGTLGLLSVVGFLGMVRRRSSA